MALCWGVWVACIALLVARLQYGFLPEDDPAFAYLGERTLQGGLPNVDFYDDYTGGLSFLNALALHMFGVRLISLRIMLLIFFALWIPTVWYLAYRITSLANTVLLTLLAAVWSVPAYPTPYGTWYNLYFATFGTAALFRYLDTGRKRWIFWAGVCGGLSFLAKVFGLYFIAAAGLFLLYDEQRKSAIESYRTVSRSAYTILISSALLCLVGGVVKLISAVGRSGGFAAVVARCYHFILPAVAVSFFLIYREWTTPRASSGIRFVSIAKRAVPFAAGVLAPIAVFLVPYIRRGALGKWYASMMLSSGRIHHGGHAPPANSLALLSIPLFFVIWLGGESGEQTTRLTLMVIVSVPLALLLALAHGHLLVAGLSWFSIAQSLPVLVVISVIFALRRHPPDNKLTQRLLLLVFVLAMLSLVQFPISAPIYFCFVAPVLFLTLIAFAESTKAMDDWRSPFFPVVVFYLLFGILAILPGELYLARFDRPPEARLTLPRAAGLTGQKEIVELYERAVPEVERHAANAPIYAGPDSPGLYFLTGHGNPTPIYLDFVAGADANPQRVLQAIDSAGVRTVIINHGGGNHGPASYNGSGPPSAELLAGLRKRFPLSTAIGFYEIRWK